MDSKFLSDYLGKEIELNKIYEGSGQSYEIPDHMEWKSGDFGDYGSCFFGYKSNSRRIMLENGLNPIRFYKGNKGYGRAFLYYLKDKDVEGLCAFNIQGLTIIEFLSFMEQEFGLKNIQIDLRSGPKVSDIVYADGYRGYLLLRERKEVPRKRYYLNLEVNYGNCAECKVKMEQVPATHNGKDYCGKCFNKLFFYCFQCSNMYESSEAVHLEGRKQIVCKNCRVDPCPNCGGKVCMNLLSVEVRRKYRVRRIPKRLWVCDKNGCYEYAKNELAKPIPKKKVKEVVEQAPTEEGNA